MAVFEPFPGILLRKKLASITPFCGQGAKKRGTELLLLTLIKIQCKTANNGNSYNVAFQYM